MPSDLLSDETGNVLNEPPEYSSCDELHVKQVVTFVLYETEGVNASWLLPTPDLESVKLLIRYLLCNFRLSATQFQGSIAYFSRCHLDVAAHKAGYVYLLEAEEGAFYKIGRTVNLDNRLTSFGVQLPFSVSLRHSIHVPDMACAELALHRRFSDKRVRGEWFILSPEDVEVIVNLGSDWSRPVSKEEYAMTV